MGRSSLLAVALVLFVAAPAAAIVGGKETDRAWPWMTAIEYGRAEADTGQLQWCGGSLVAPRWVLTAAHCMEKLVGEGYQDPELLAVSIGRHDKDEMGAGERIQVVAIHPHEQYDWTVLDGYDLALVELAAPAKAPPIKIAGIGEEAAWARGAAATVLGWGFTSPEGFSPPQDKLKEATLTVTDDCPIPGGYEPATSMCTKAPADSGVCGGDSGGPLVAAVGDQWRLIGVLSWAAYQEMARPCEPGYYAGFDRIAASPLREWIAARVPEAFAPAATVPAPAVAPTPPASPQPAPARRRRAKFPPRRLSKAYVRCLKRAGKNRRKRRACRRAEARRRHR